MTGKLISFIIPYKGREQYLQQTLQSILAQDIVIDQLEVLIIKQNERLLPETEALINGIDSRIFFRPESDTISALRNFGVQHSTGRHLAFLDADIRLSPNWASDLLAELESTDSRVLISAAQTCTIDTPPLEQIRTALSNADIDANVNFLPGRNLLLSRETFSSAGGFPEHLITWEDYYFTDRVNQLGGLYYSSKANYVHLGEDKDFDEMHRKEIWRGQSNLQSLKGRKISLREIPSFVVPISLLLLLIVFDIALISGYPDFALVALSLAVTPLILYTLRLYRIARNTTSFVDVLKFYLYYFPARALGTLGGIFRTIGNTSHNK